MTDPYPSPGTPEDLRVRLAEEHGLSEDLLATVKRLRDREADIRGVLDSWDRSYGVSSLSIVLRDILD